MTFSHDIQKNVIKCPRFNLIYIFFLCVFLHILVVTLVIFWHPTCWILSVANIMFYEYEYIWKLEYCNALIWIYNLFKNVMHACVISWLYMVYNRLKLGWWSIVHIWKSVIAYLLLYQIYGLHKSRASFVFVSVS